jgi:hypothetical protein
VLEEIRESYVLLMDFKLRVGDVGSKMEIQVKV